MAYQNKTYDQSRNNFNKVNKEQKPPVELSQEYRTCVNSGYYIKGENGLSSIKKELLIDFALENASKFAQEKVASTQLRSFYNVVKQVETYVDITDKTFEQLMEDIYPLLSVAHLKIEKGTLPKVFEDFIKLNVNKLSSKEDIKAFDKHFKAILCYMPQKKN